MDNPEGKLTRIKTILERMSGADAEEILLEIQQVMPSKVEYITEQPKNSPEQLEYMRKWRAERKKRLALVAKGNKKEELNQLKIQKALKRSKFFCFQCKEPVEVDPLLNKHVIENKRGRLKKNIILLNKCPKCFKELRIFGGSFEV